MPRRGGLIPSRVAINGLRPRQIRAAQPRSYATVDKPLPLTSSPVPKVVESKPSASTPGGPPLPPPRKKRHLFRKTVAYSTLLTVAAYGIGTVAAVNNERAHDFFVESVPLGEAIVDYLETQGYVGGLPRGSTAPLAAPFTVPKGDAPSIKPAQPPAPVPTTITSKEGIQPKPKAEPKPKSEAQIRKEEAKAAAQAKIEAAKAKAKETAKTTGDRLKQVAATVHTAVEKQPAGSIRHPPIPVNIERLRTPGRPARLSGGVEELVNEVEVALEGAVVTEVEQAKSGDIAQVVESSAPTEEERKPPPGKQWYEGPPLPLGWEPPPGYVTRPPKKVPRANSGLLLVAPSVSSFAPLEPVLADLASTIDNLAKYLEDHPKSLKGADKVLQHAQSDLMQLGEQIRKSKEEAKLELETKLDQQAREYSMHLLDTDIKHQDQLDTQDEDWRKYFDQERLALLQRYQEKLDQELAAQEDIINQRLKEQVISQGIEMQRRWLREVQVHVEEERGGRLAKLENLATDLKRLERITLDNAAYLDENLRLHAVWSALRALQTASLDAPVRKPFRNELRVLKHIASAAGQTDKVTIAALESLEESDAPDVGVEPLADLVTWFTTSVVPRVSAVALIPDHGSQAGPAGLLSHLASSLVSGLRFRRRGLVEGDDPLSVMARAEYYLNEDLDSATRELNQLKGPAKVLLHDWLAAARRRLEVQQALEIVQAQSTLASLLIL